MSDTRAPGTLNALLISGVLAAAACSSGANDSNQGTAPSPVCPDGSCESDGSPAEGCLEETCEQPSEPDPSPGTEQPSEFRPLPVAEPAGEPKVFVFGAEDNRLNAFDAKTGARQTVIPKAADGGLDINAQICFHEWNDKFYFIAGEDTGQKAEGSPGWGWFELVGDEIGGFSAIQHGKLRPTWAPQSVNQPENYGCGFLPDGLRMITTDVGDQRPQEAPSGQLLVWFLDPTSGFDDATHADLSTTERFVDNSEDKNYCKIDTQIATAGGSWIHDGWAYVASNRPGSNGPGGIYRYRLSNFPKDASCAGHGNQADLVAVGVVERQLWLASDNFVMTPSAIVPSGRKHLDKPTWYVSSVFNGVIAEYADLGDTRVWVRNIVEPPAALPVGQVEAIPTNTKGTPFGLGVTPSGDLWYADMGIEGDGPVADKGSVQRVRFDDKGNIVGHDIVDDKLLYPDGIGIVVFGKQGQNP